MSDSAMAKITEHVGMGVGGSMCVCVRESPREVLKPFIRYVSFIPLSLPALHPFHSWEETKQPVGTSRVGF